MIAYQLVTNCVTREITQRVWPLGHSPKQKSAWGARLGQAASSISSTTKRSSSSSGNLAQNDLVAGSKPESSPARGVEFRERQGILLELEQGLRRLPRDHGIPGVDFDSRDLERHGRSPSRNLFMREARWHSRRR
jgi:hypothetical protein